MQARILAALCLVAPVASAANVIVIDAAGGPGADFTDLSGLAAAQDGDVVLVRAGDYGGTQIVLDGVGFHLIAEEGASVRFTAGLVIQNLAASQSMSVRGIDFETLNLRLASCAGTVLLEDCTFLTEGIQIAVPALEATSCAAVVLVRCGLRFKPLSQVQFDGDTVLASNTAFFLHQTTVEGLEARGGLAAMRLHDCDVHLSGSTVQGGVGGDGILGGPTGCTNGGVGGTGMELTGTSTVELVDSLVLGGPGGHARLSTCEDGPDGPAFVLSPSSSVVTLPGDAVALDYPSPLRSGEQGTPTFTASPGDPVWLLYAVEPLTPPLSLAVFDGYLHLDPLSLDGQAAGVVPPSGELVLELLVPPFPGLDAAVFLTQPLTLSSTLGRFVLGSPSEVVVLDPAF